MEMRHYLLRANEPTAATAATLEAVALEAAHNLGVVAAVEDFSLVMGEPSVAVEIRAAADEHDQMLAVWTSNGLRIEDLDDEVRALRQPGQEG
jgi:hypothetical protein